MSELTDRIVVCRERTCNQEFTLTAGEQDFYATRGLNTPTRCKACRDRRKAEAAGQQPMPQAIVQAPPPPMRFEPSAQEVEIQNRKTFGKRVKRPKNKYSHREEDDF